MRSASGACGRSAFAFRSPPYGVMQIVHNGQSLSVGYNQTPVSLTQPYSNVMLHDSSGTYDITAPTAPTLSLIPLVAPERPLGGVGGTYPNNINGESAEVAMANQLALLYQNANFRRPVVIPACTGIGGAPMTAIDVGTTPYKAGIYECEAIAARPPGFPGTTTFGTVGVPFTHGETDSVNNANANIQTPTTYEGLLVALQAGYQSSFNAVFGQANKGIIPIVFSPTACAPGALQGWNTTAWACLDAWQANPTLFVYACPKYQFTYSGLFHLADYRPLGEKYAQKLFYFLQAAEGDPLPLYITNIEVSGRTITVTYHVPVPPLVFDTVTVPQQHQSGEWVAWANGMGLEAWDTNNTVTNATNASPIQVTFQNPHGLSSGDTYSIWGVLGNTAANGTFTVTVVDPMNVTLNGTTGNGAYTASSGMAFRALTISTAVISGDGIVVTLAQDPASDLIVGCGEHVDGAYSAVGSAARITNIRDSDPFVGRSAATPIHGVPLPQPIWSNWAIEEFHPVPYASPI